MTANSKNSKEYQQTLELLNNFVRILPSFECDKQIRITSEIQTAALNMIEAIENANLEKGCVCAMAISGKSDDRCKEININALKKAITSASDQTSVDIKKMFIEPNKKIKTAQENVEEAVRTAEQAKETEKMQAEINTNKAKEELLQAQEEAVLIRTPTRTRRGAVSSLDSTH